MEKDFYPAYYELETTHWWFLGRRVILNRVLDRFAGRDIRACLDFGTGTGAFLDSLERFGRVSAVDADPDAVAFCHRRGRDEVLHVAPGATLPFPDGSFDLVTSFDVLEHIEDDVAALRDLHRVLRPGGRLVVAVPAFQILWGDQDEISHHFRRYRAPQLRERMEAAGFTVVHTSYFNTLLFPPVAAIRILRRALRAPSSEKTDFTIGPAFTNRWLARLFAAEARPVAGRGLPFGVSALAVATSAA